MAANKAVVVNASGAIVAPVSAATFRNNNGLQIGLNIQAWSANLDSAATHISWSGSNATFASEIVATSSITTTTGNLIVTVGDVITGGGVFATGNISGAQLRLANAGTGAFNTSIVHNGTLTAEKTLTLNVSDGNRTLQMGGDLFLGANFTTTNQGALTLTVSGATNVTLPTTGTLATLAGTETLSGKTLTAPKFADLGFIADANGNELIVMDTVASAVNEWKVANAAASGTPELAVQGGDTNIGMNFTTKGSGLAKFANSGASMRVDIDNPSNTGFRLMLGGVAKWSVATTGNFLIFDETTGNALVITNGTRIATFSGPVVYPSYTVAGVPSAATSGAGANIYVTNETGGAIPAFSDGTNWRRYSDRAIIS